VKSVLLLLRLYRDKEGLKKEDSAVILQRYQLYHNFVRPHEALDGKTSSEACGITVEGDNNWKTLQNAQLDRPK
jgi:hypothetical protein